MVVCVCVFLPLLCVRVYWWERANAFVRFQWMYVWNAWTYCVVHFDGFVFKCFHSFLLGISSIVCGSHLLQSDVRLRCVALTLQMRNLFDRSLSSFFRSVFFFGWKRCAAVVVVLLLYCYRAVCFAHHIQLLFWVIYVWDFFDSRSLLPLIRACCSMKCLRSAPNTHSDVNGEKKKRNENRIKDARRRRRSTVCEGSSECAMWEWWINIGWIILLSMRWTHVQARTPKIGRCFVSS